MKSNFFKTNLFKIIATVMVILFALIVIGGLMRFSHYKSSFVKMDETQISSAKEVALSALEVQGKNSSDYEVRIMPQFRQMREKNNSLSLVEVSFYNQNETQLFLIDINTNKIVMHSETEFYDADYFKPELASGCANKRENESKREDSRLGECSRSPEEGRWFHGEFTR